MVISTRYINKVNLMRQPTNSQISCKRTQRKFTFNLLSAAEIHRIILLRQTLNTSPLRVKTPLVLPKLWQSRSAASYILPSEEEGLVRGGALFG